MCGEKIELEDLTTMEKGSPPHVRGKGAAPALALGEIGITPACAGKSRAAAKAAAFQRDHPRMCGEKTKKIP